MINEVLAQLIDFIKSASPIIWETYVRQVYMQALTNAVGGIALFFASIYCVFGSLHKLKSTRHVVEDGDNAGWGVAVFFSVIIVALSIGVIMGAVTRYLNPNYYAIQMILETIKR